MPTTRSKIYKIHTILIDIDSRKMANIIPIGEFAEFMIQGGPQLTDQNIVFYELALEMVYYCPH